MSPTIPAPSPASIPANMALLAREDPVVREEARQTLVKIGSREVIAALVAELSDPRQHVRWEVVKALVTIGDPIAAPALLNALDDDDGDIRWVAAEGLIRLGKPGLLAALYGLTKQARSPAFCKSAHHVLRAFAESEYGPLLTPVIKALEDFEPAVAAPPAALTALLELKLALT